MIYTQVVPASHLTPACHPPCPPRSWPFPRTTQWPWGVPGEVLGRVVDHPVGAQAPDQLHVLAVADRGHPGTKALQQLDRGRADGPGGAIDQDVLPTPELGLPDHREGIVRTLGAGRGLLEGHVRRHGRKRTVLRHRHVFSVRAEPGPVVAEHPVADLKGGDATADRLDFSGEFIPEDGHPWSCEPGEEPIDEGLGRPQGAVCPVHRRGMDLDQHLVVLGRRLLDLGDPNHVRRTVAGVDGCLHGWTVATTPRSAPRRRRQLSTSFAPTVTSATTVAQTIWPAAALAHPLASQHHVTASLTK